MGLILNDLKNACELEHVCDYVNNRTTSSMNYISTENMLPNKGGISMGRQTKSTKRIAGKAVQHTENQ